MHEKKSRTIYELSLIMLGKALSMILVTAKFSNTLALRRDNIRPIYFDPYCYKAKSNAVYPLMSGVRMRKGISFSSQSNSSFSSAVLYIS